MQQTLQETGLYRVVLTSSFQEALLLVASIPFELAILDVEIGDANLDEVIAQLKTFSADVRFIFIYSDPRASYPVDRNVLFKPFYQPDLLEMVRSVLPGSKLAHSTPLQLNLQQERQEREDNAEEPWLLNPFGASQRLASLALSSAAQGIILVKQEQVWAFAGQMTQPAAEEITRIVLQYWAPSAGKFQGKKGDLARFIRLGSTGGEHLLFAAPLGNGMILAVVFEAEAPFSEVRAEVTDLQHALTSPQNERRSYQPLLENVPPPLPEPNRSRSVQQNLSEALPGTAPALVQTAQSNHPVLESQPKVSFLEEPSIQSGTSVVHDLCYFCLVAPRMPHHQLVGDLAKKLAEWVGQFCMAYGWRLDHLSISPESMQWVVNLAPDIAPGKMVQVLCQQTSERIFDSFPEICRENPSGDFWAPGFLLITRLEQVSELMIEDFIHQVRQYQGISPESPSRLRR